MKKTYKNEIQKILEGCSINNEVLEVFKVWGYLYYSTKDKSTNKIFKHKLNVGLNASFDEAINLIKLNYLQTDLIDFLDGAKK